MARLPYQSFDNKYVIKKSKDNSTPFKEEIKHLVDDLESKQHQKILIQLIYSKLNAKRRRLYDVINVLNAVGCFTRAGTDYLYWNGKEKILEELKIQKTKYKIDDWSLSLDQLFPSDAHVSIKSLTIAFLLLYSAIGANVIDLKATCMFFSRNSNRYRTTLCKLYQIILILGAINVVSKTDSVRQIHLLSPYCECLLGNNGPDSIEFLLNRTDNDKNNQIKKRRDEFTSFLTKK